MDFQMPDTPILLSGEDYAYLSECFEPLSAADFKNGAAEICGAAQVRNALSVGAARAENRIERGGTLCREPVVHRGENGLGSGTNLRNFPWTGLHAVPKSGL